MKKKSSIINTLTDTYKKEGNQELKSYVGYLGEGAAQDETT